MASYYGPFAQLENLGILDVILPFILVFTIVFAVLQKAKLFGNSAKENKRYDAVIALVMGLGVVFPHVLGYYPPEQDIVNIINQSLPNVSVVIVAIVMALLLIGALGGNNFGLKNDALSGSVAIGAFALIVYIFGNAAHWWDSPSWLYFLNDSDTVTLIIAILIFALIIWFVVRDDSKPSVGIGAHVGNLFEKRKD